MKKILALTLVLSLCLISVSAQKRSNLSLGISVVDYSDDEKISLGLCYDTPGGYEAISGLYVESVEKGSLAATQGIKPGDLIFLVSHPLFNEYDNRKKCEITKKEIWHIHRISDLLNVLNYTNGNEGSTTWEFSVSHLGEKDRIVFLFFRPVL